MKKRGLSLLLAILMVVAVFSPAMGIIASAAAGDTVELAFNNIFVFESWATNKSSSVVSLDGVPRTDGITIDIPNGSFTMTREFSWGGAELYTSHSMNSTNAIVNEPFYHMDVEPNTAYNFGYDVTGDIWFFRAFVFYFDAEGLYIDMAFYDTPGYGYNEFTFNTPANAGSIQIRFTIMDNSDNHVGATAVSATVKDIAIYETELKNQYLATQNKFSFEEWADNAYSSSASSLSPDNGSVVSDASTGTITLTCTSGNFWTGFGIDTEGSNDAYYTVDVDPTKSYTLAYDVTDISLPGPVHCQPWIVELDSSGKCVTFYQNDQNLRFGGNMWTFTCQNPATARIQVVFSVVGVSAEASCKVSNIGVYETSFLDAALVADFETVTGYPHRLTYKEGAGTYGELPAPTNVPEGMVFAGWYTGKNGSGERITADTEISYKSFTVYPYYQAKVDSLSIKTLPTKTEYTLGEKVNPTGLVLTGTQGTGDDASSFSITSGYTIEPAYVTKTGTQTITVSYGGKTATFNVNVKEYVEKTVSVNGSDVVAKVANNVYTLNYTAPEAFSRYEITYYSDSYVKGTITMADGTYEDFFLEPSTNGKFASYIDDYLTGGTYTNVKSISFECLDKEFGNFELYSLDTIYVQKPADTMAYYTNDEYKAGINLAWGGVLAYLQDYKHNPVAATYSNGITQVNYSSQLPSGSTAQSNAVNLINVYDKGRYVQQSYYGTREEPYVLGDYNGLEWNYNPIQGGNILGEASKVVDYRITDTEIYVKTRPLEWAKWSDEAAEAYNASQPDPSKHKDAIYEDSYNAWAYMESWYVFEDGMLKTYCRYVDYSGYPSATTTQEFPAFYCVEPLNNFVYYSGGDAWSNSNTVQWESDLDFWGATPEYNQMLMANGLSAVDPNYDCNENWAAFMGGTTNKDYGIGIYTADVTNFVAGTYHAKYKEGQTSLVPQDTYLRHADTLDPATEDPTAYIAPVGTMELNSFQEYTYSYYITTGTQEQIREDFRRAKEQDEAEASAGTKIAVPETVYMTPVGTPTATTKAGQYYVNNVLDSNNYFNVKTVASSTDEMYFGIYAEGAKQYKISVTNATNPADDIVLGNAGGTGNVENQWFTVGETGHDIRDEEFSLRFATTGLKPGEIATAKWEITVEYKDGTIKTHTVFTVLYAPGLTVGAVAEGRQNDSSSNEVSSWITGANGVDHSQRAPLGSYHGDYHDSGYFRVDPLANLGTLPTGGTAESEDDYILFPEHTDFGGSGTSVDYSETSYVLSTATNGHDSSRAQSYLGLLTVDGSRYTNTNQIPNLRIGYDVLRIGSATKNSVGQYRTYYTLGTTESFVSTTVSDTPSGWSTKKSEDDFASSNSIPNRDSFVPSYDVNSLDGKYIHALIYTKLNSVWSEPQYSTAGTSVLCTVTDKSGLRESVLKGYNVAKDDLSDDAYNKMLEALEEAATVLGDPSASQDAIDNAQKELDDALAPIVNIYYSLKYDNLFSAYEYSQFADSMTASQPNSTTVSYENGVITVENVAFAGATETYTKYGSGSGYYLVDLMPNTEYVFEYDVTTTEKAQAFMFFYNAGGTSAEAPTNMSIKVNDGAWSSKSESNAHWGNYTNGAGTYHYAIKFTTGATTVKASFRFGNTSNNAVTSSFSNIRLITSGNYYEGATYSATEAVYQQYASYGTLATATRPFYTFAGWKDGNGNAVTGATLATKNLTVYSQWTEVQYTIKYNGNGGAGSTTSATIAVSKPAALPGDYTRDNYTLLGWSFDANAKAADFKVGQTITLADAADHIDGNNQITLYAVWERNYSVYYSSNGGTGTVNHTYKPLSQAHILPDDSTISRDGYVFLGWALEPDATTPDYKAGENFYVGNIDSKYINETKQEVILHAVWYDPGKINVTFDNLIDISKWSTSVNNGVLENVTDTGFTVMSNAGVGEATCSSDYFAIEAGHKYVVEADIKGDGWDVYIFFCDANGNWVEFSDSGNRFASYGLNVTKNGIHCTSIEFTAPAGAVKAQLRVDANNGSNAVRFENIRVYDAANKTYLDTVNKYVEYFEAYGELPVPVKEGSQFLGWVDGKGNTVTAESIMNSATTVYLTSTWTVNPNTANDDTVVIEYGSSVTINVLANDKAGTVSGIGTKGVSDTNLNKVSFTSSILTDKASTLTLTAGTVKLNGDGTITFTPSNTNVSEEIVFYYELQANGAYYYAKVTIIPATTIYFEDTFFTFKDSTVTSGGKTYDYKWQNLGTSVGDVFQSTDRPGTFNFADDANNVYGYDAKSDGTVAYSGGSAHFTEVDKIAGTSAPTATFTFTGTGFDLFSVTDSKSGTVTVTIYKGTDTTERVMGLMSNAYFGYTYDAGSDSYTPTDNGALFQVPLIRAQDLAYGTYTVVVQPRYNYAFDVAKTGKSGVYVDSVRIYDPMGYSNAAANDAYKADGEYAPQYLEIRDTLVTSQKDENGYFTGSYDVSELGKDKSVFLDGGKTSMDDFANLGPKNEVYLQNGNSIAFDIVTDRPGLPATIQLGMKLTGKGGSVATVSLMNASYNGWSKTYTLNSTEERYYNIEAVVDWVEQADGTYKTASPIIVTNTSGAIISLTSLKWAFESDYNNATVLSLMSDMDTPVLAMAAIMRMNNPQDDPQQTILNKENISYEFSADSYTVGDVGTLTITTEEGVEGVTVNGTDVLDYVTTEDGKLEWTFEFTAESAGSMTFEIIAHNEEGIMSEAIYAQINIEDVATGDGENDATEPDDDVIDDTTEPDDEITDDTIIDSGIGGLTGIDSFAANLVNNIFALIAKILSLLFGGVMA